MNYDTVVAELGRLAAEYTQQAKEADAKDPGGYGQLFHIAQADGVLQALRAVKDIHARVGGVA